MRFALAASTGSILLLINSSISSCAFETGCVETSVPTTITWDTYSGSGTLFIFIVTLLPDIISGSILTEVTLMLGCSTITP
uniref:Putative secreted protein n=1 Tax=Panstrongylus lignarius TaxID=156445 RepID=A0A224XZS1_9HEMI